MRNTLSFLFKNKNALWSMLFLLLGVATIVLLLRGPAKVPESPFTRPPETVRKLDLRGKELTLEDYRRYRETYPNAAIRWDIPVGDRRFDSRSAAITVSGYTAADRQALELFDSLRSVRFVGELDYPALGELYRSEPNFSVGWNVPLGKKLYSSGTALLSVDASAVSAEELRSVLPGLPALERVVLDNFSYSAEEIAALRDAFPSVLFRWPVRLLGQTFQSTDEEISFAGRDDLTAASLREIRDSVGQFNDLKAVDLSDCGFDGDVLHSLDRQLGDTDVIWTMDLYGAKVRSTDEEIDLSRRIIRDNGKAVEDVIPWMSHLKKVVLCEVNISNKDLAEMYEKYLPLGVRIVWMVQIKWGGIRTDSDHFIPYPESGARQYPTTIGLNNLYYCPDLVALDLGHSNIKDLGFLSVMPHLKYLILADSWVMDLTEVGTLKELTWLELFQTGSKDVSPLVNCTSLEHLNICYIIAPGDNIYETLRQMTWLKRIWCCGTRMTDEQIQKLHEELPDCEIWSKMGDESTGSTWRFHPAYYEMRDAFHMYYMNIEGNTVGRLTDEEIDAVHKRYWGY